MKTSEYELMVNFKEFNNDLGNAAMSFSTDKGIEDIYLQLDIAIKNAIINIDYSELIEDEIELHAIVDIIDNLGTTGPNKVIKGSLPSDKYSMEEAIELFSKEIKDSLSYNIINFKKLN